MRELSSAELHRAKRNVSEALWVVKAAQQPQGHPLSPCSPAHSPREGLMGKPTDRQP